MQKIKELRQIIREKDFEIEDTKRVCMDIVQQKEQAYQALLDDTNKIRDQHDEYRKMIQKKFFEMGQEFKKQKRTQDGEGGGNLAQQAAAMQAAALQDAGSDGSPASQFKFTFLGI